MNAPEEEDRQSYTFFCPFVESADEVYLWNTFDGLVAAGKSAAILVAEIEVFGKGSLFLYFIIRKYIFMCIIDGFGNWVTITQSLIPISVHVYFGRGLCYEKL